MSSCGGLFGRSAQHKFARDLRISLRWRRLLAHKLALQEKHEKWPHGRRVQPIRRKAARVPLGSQTVRQHGGNLPSRDAEGCAMTMPHERTRALLWAGGFFIELARDESLPLEVRQRAVAIARHFPTVENIGLMAGFRHSTGLGVGLVAPEEAGPWDAECPSGPLRNSTRLGWPEHSPTRVPTR